MKNYLPLKQVSKQLRLVALLICALSICFSIGAAQVLPTDNSASHETLYGNLAWDADTVKTYKKTLPITLRNRKIKHYALTAALVGGVAGYIWYINQSDSDAESATPEKGKTTEPTPTADQTVKKAWLHNEGDMSLTEENFRKNCELLKKNAEALKTLRPDKTLEWIRWGNFVGVNVPYSPKILDPIFSWGKTLVTWQIGTLALQRAASIFSFREDMVWFYNEEKSIATVGKNLEALALNFDAAVATKQPNSIILLKKQILLESAHDYLDRLMSLYVFMEYQSAQVLAKFAPEIREKLQQKFALQTTSLMQNGIEFCQKLNDAVEKTAQSPLPVTENARAIVMQTHNLVQALVASFVRLEDLYNK